MAATLPTTATYGQVTPAEAKAIAEEAYIYGYPLVTMEFTRRVMTNTAEPEGTHAPMGQFLRMRTYPDASFKDVTAPNADTLYSTAWLDLAKEPYVLSLPDVGDRYFLMPMLDGWTNVFQVPGTRTTGNKAQTYAITGPGWKGTLPAGVKELKSPTDMVWILGRTYCTGTPEDYKACHAVMDKYQLVPLSSYGKPYTPPAGKVDPIDRREDRRPRAGESAADRRLFQAAGRPDEGQSAGHGRRADRREDGQDRHRARQGVRREQARSGRGEGARRRSAGGLREDHGALQNGRHRRERLDLHDQDRSVRHRVPAAGAGHGDRPRRQPPAGRRLSDVRSRRRRQAVQRREQVRHALRQGPDAAGQRLLVDHDVQRRLLLRGQPAQQVHGQPAQRI